MTAEDGTLIAPGTRLVNAFNKETFIFHDSREGLLSVAFQVLLDAGGSGGGNAVAHIHPESDEHFTVHAGVLKVMIDGQPTLARAGETVTVPRGAAHYFANAHDGPTEVTIRFTPAQSQLRFFISFATIAATRQRLVRRPRRAAQTAAGPHAAHLSRPFLRRRSADLGFRRSCLQPWLRSRASKAIVCRSHPRPESAKGAMVQHHASAPAHCSSG